MIRRLLLSAAIAALGLPACAATVAIVNAHILGTAGGEIASGTVVITDAKITAVGANVSAPAGARVIDAKGAVVTPGFFAIDSELAAVEVGALGSDLKVDNPDLGAAFDVQYALDPDSVLLPVARLGGVTRAVVTPQTTAGDAGADDEAAQETAGPKSDASKAHSLFAGQAAVIHLGRGPEILVRPKVGMVVPFGRAGASVAGGARGAEIVALKAALQDVRDYARGRAAYDRGGFRDLSLSKADLEALIPVVEGRMPIIAVVHKAADIRAVLKLAREENVRVILSGAEEGWRLAGEIAAAHVPVLLNPLNDRPETFEMLSASMDNAARLNAAGVLVAIEASENTSHRAREIRYDAGNAVAHGMPYGAALAAITLNPARIFGVDATSGSIEAGKDADVVIWSGDPFEPLSRPLAVFVRGDDLPLTSRQLELQDRYRTLGRPLPPAYSH
ncbi:MAG TPA: amidohydrolase family protein [Caulobacteraceae bacterium]|jgi:imidazolonepropionase-like amidohydrolase|nr:amidohydrolase family protein [Caulobacteraceae bacterium]